jgi:hypothetical protein
LQRICGGALPLAAIRYEGNFFAVYSSVAVFAELCKSAACIGLKREATKISVVSELV